MLRIITLSLLASGCAILRGSPTPHDPIGSPCFDGIMVNLVNEKCSTILSNQVPGEPILRVSCEDNLDLGSRDPDLAWSQSFFYVTPVGYPQVDLEWSLLCRDFNSDVFFVPRVTNIRPPASEDADVSSDSDSLAE